jgi:hypothetical protein
MTLFYAYPADYHAKEEQSEMMLGEQLEEERGIIGQNLVVGWEKGLRYL